MTAPPTTATGPGPAPVDDVLPRSAHVEQVMGLPVSIHVRGPRARDAAATAAVTGAFARLRADDAQFSTYRPDSEVSRVQRGQLPVADASPRLRLVAALCHEASQRTDGAFSAWLPRDGRPVFDPTGLVKGWAVQEAFEALQTDLRPLGAHDVLVVAGGDVALTCARTDTPDWVVGVEDPRERTSLLLQLPMRVGAVATSGTAARGLHVLDPRTGSPAASLLSATVVGPRLMWADVDATALLAAGGQAPWFTARPEHAALVVRPDGSTQRLGGRADAEP
ncbi:FAD:protein FMN transferase [Dermatophilaceae bacterium Soc4.6]